MNDIVFKRYSIAIVTPFEDTPDQNIDEAGVRAVVAKTCEGLAELRAKSNNVGGIIVSGSTGEQHSMSKEERVRLYSLVVEEANIFRVPVACGVAATTTKMAKELAQAAVEAGCAGIMLGLPPYCRCDDNELTSYVEGVKSVLPAVMPVLLYNNTVRNGYGPSLSTLLSWHHRGLIIGIKYAVLPHSLALTNSQWLLEQDPTLRLYTGSDALFRELAGREGFVHPDSPDDQLQLQTSPFRYYGLTSIVGNICPIFMGRTVLKLTESDDIDTAAIDSKSDTFAIGCQMHQQILPLIQSVLVNISVPVGIKYALKLRGIRAGVCRSPVGLISEEKKAEIESANQETISLT